MGFNSGFKGLTAPAQCKNATK